uniref:Uncharacterized protein n=1 Tax=Eutreptiella gymnastica TaxID=73025 RepID=A0A7S4FST2_9EUGL
MTPEVVHTLNGHFTWNMLRGDPGKSEKTQGLQQCDKHNVRMAERQSNNLKKENQNQHKIREKSLYPRPLTPVQLLYNSCTSPVPCMTADPSSTPMHNSSITPLTRGSRANGLMWSEKQHMQDTASEEQVTRVTSDRTGV